MTALALASIGYFLWQRFRNATTTHPKKSGDEVTPFQARVQLRDWLAENEDQKQNRGLKARQRRHATFKKRQRA
ncbi:MAG: hypothetical protein VX768_12005 [Planctomycetota bacterium]|nr:hypothetical protein [Planctomycetota bacterium]